MKTELDVTNFSYNGTLYCIFKIKDKDVSIRALFNMCTTETEYDLYIVKDDRGERGRIPNYAECSYRDEYEAFMFQESLVWEKDVDFFLVKEIQEYFQSNHKKLLHDDSKFTLTLG